MTERMKSRRNLIERIINIYATSKHESTSDEILDECEGILEEYYGKYSSRDYEVEVMRTAGGKDYFESCCGYSMGLAGEAGEVIDVLKKHIFHGHDLDREKLKKEFGDAEWYLTALEISNGFTKDEILQANVEKLRKRYKNGFTQEESINREEYKQKS